MIHQIHLFISFSICFTVSVVMADDDRMIFHLSIDPLKGM
jgi:hypothetical protein